MSRFIHDPLYPNQNAQSHHVKRMLGVGEKWNLPKEGMPPRLIQGIKVWVTPLPEMPAGRRTKRSAHRVLAECPDCKRTVSVGRLRQHVCPPEKLQPGEPDPRD
jgi:hypothetical protein